MKTLKRGIMLTNNAVPKKSIGKEVNIPLSAVSDIQVFLSLAFDTDTTYIGGRAVNLLCFGSARPTHDVDIVLARKPYTFGYEELPLAPGKDGVYFELDRDPSFTASRVKLKYFSPEVKSISSEGYVEIDTYYPGYKSPVNGFVPSNTINRIPISEIIETSITVRIGSTSFTVANPDVLVAMKYMTWLERGNGMENAKDISDIKNIIRNHFSSENAFLGLIERVERLSSRHGLLQPGEIAKGISDAVYKSERSNSTLKDAARDVIRKNFAQE